MSSTPVIDADQHLFEPRTMWSDHIDPAHRDDALAIEDDELGWPWLTWRGRRIYQVESQVPMQPHLIGEERAMRERGERAPRPYEELVPPEYTDAKARVSALDGFGLDAAVVFPNFGLTWESTLDEDLGALCANLRACNRWQAEVAQDGGGRLFPVAHLSLRDRDWAVEEIGRVGRDGIRLAMVAPAPVDGKALSHPDLDPVWRAFCDAGVIPTFHVAAFAPPFDPAWYEGDPEPVDRLLTSVFLWVAPAVAIANMTLHGTFERFPDLRLAIVELTAGWVPTFLLHLDGALDFYAARHGGHYYPLSKRPSEYVMGQVRVAALAYEGPARLVERVSSELFMFGSDWPHSEGIAQPRADYERALAGLTDDEARARLMGGNLAELLRA